MNLFGRESKADFLGSLLKGICTRRCDILGGAQMAGASGAVVWRFLSQKEIGHIPGESDVELPDNPSDW